MQTIEAEVGCQETLGPQEEYQTKDTPYHPLFGLYIDEVLDSPKPPLDEPNPSVVQSNHTHTSICR